MDVLTDVLLRSRARGAAFAYTTLRGRGGLDFPAGTSVGVHAVVNGDGVVWTRDPERTLPVRAGDLVLVRRAAHAIAPTAGAPCTPIQEVIDAGRGVAGPDDEPVSLVLLCGAYLFEGDLFEPVLRHLPDVLVCRPTAGSTLWSTVDLLARSMHEDGPGQQAMLDRLLDVTLIQVLRERFAAEPDVAPPWFAGEADDRIGPALRAIHADPSRPWTVAELADRAALSRAAFARRFTELVGRPPLQYLFDWRMALAREELRRPDVGLAAVAATVGYRSEYAFAAAFKRHHGMAPGRWRASTAPPPEARPLAG